MDKELDKDDNGNWVAPLPFKDNRSRLPDNRFMAMRRAKTFDVNLGKDSVFVVRSNIVSLSNSEDGIAFCSILLTDNCSLTVNLFSQGLSKDVRPLGITNVLYTLTLSLR
jgi:hypothetical protein